MHLELLSSPNVLFLYHLKYALTFRHSLLFPFSDQGITKDSNQGRRPSWREQPNLV